MKYCDICERSWPEEFFRVARSIRNRDGNRRYARTATICIGCEQRERDENKRGIRKRFMQKAADTIRRHAIKFRVTAKDMERL